MVAAAHICWLRGIRGLAVTAMNISECPQPPQARPLYGVTSPLDVLHAGPDEGAASGHQERLAVAAAWQQGTLATCIDVRYIETCQQPFIDASNMSATPSGCWQHGDWRLTRHHHGLVRAAGLEAPGHPPDLLLPPGLVLGPAAVLGGGWVAVQGRGGG